MGKALVCDRCGAVINFSKAKHTSMFRVEWHSYITSQSITPTECSKDICADCMDEMFDFIKEKKEEDE